MDDLNYSGVPSLLDLDPTVHFDAVSVYSTCTFKNTEIAESLEFFYSLIEYLVQRKKVYSKENMNNGCVIACLCDCHGTKTIKIN